MKPMMKILILVAVCALIAIYPLMTITNSEFGGADGSAADLAMELNPDYAIWAESIIAPPGGETEGLLFALQAALGSGVIFYTFGYLNARKKFSKEET